MTDLSRGALPTITPNMSFDEASAAVIDYLREQVPLGYWAVTRFDGDRQLYLEVRDDVYDLGAGDSHAWEDSFCVRMLDGEGPQVAEDAMAVPAYAEAGVARQIPIGSYVGVPIRHGDGAVFGTLCGLDPETKLEQLERHAALFGLLSSLLTIVLEADLARTEQQRALERAELTAEKDALTGLLNRRGWDRALGAEEARYRRFGEPGSVIVIDLDRLKEINDAWGHEEGDRYIARAAEALKECLRGYDYIARLGGDEFGIVAASTTPEQTKSVVARIHVAFERAGVSGSIGHAPFTIVAGFPGAYARADAAMYEQKRLRRGTPGRRPPRVARPPGAAIG